MRSSYQSVQFCVHYHNPIFAPKMLGTFCTYLGRPKYSITLHYLSNYSSRDLRKIDRFKDVLNVYQRIFIFTPAYIIVLRAQYGFMVLSQSHWSQDKVTLRSASTSIDKAAEQQNLCRASEP
ncbi:hypothetical protein C0J52_20798 [Blattella germanica]|nr:hypothetical protein C0J52_20798 [Blattella germanica]